MTDRDLLELAAKAAGLAIDKSYGDKTGFDVCGNVVLDWLDGVTWNPLIDDGAALRLAVTLGLDIDRVSNGYVTVRPMDSDHGRDLRISICLSIEKDPYAATRRAIVRAAAEIGKGMK